MKSRILLTLLLAGMALGVNAGQVYKWVDASGKVHYTDQPGPGDAGGKQVNVDVSSAPSVVGEKSAPQSLAEKERDARKRKSGEDEAKVKKEKEAADKKTRESNCARARESLRTLELGGRLTHYDESGELVVMDDAARQQSAAEAQKDIDSWCK
jgi:hypothetical protein